jgi:hypothetical protein
MPVNHNFFHYPRLSCSTSRNAAVSQAGRSPCRRSPMTVAGDALVKASCSACHARRLTTQQWCGQTSSGITAAESAHRLSQRPSIIARPPVVGVAGRTMSGETAENSAQELKHCLFTTSYTRHYVLVAKNAGIPPTPILRNALLIQESLFSCGSKPSFLMML